MAPLVLMCTLRHALTLWLCGLQELTFLDDDVTVEHARVGAQRQAPATWHLLIVLYEYITRQNGRFVLRGAQKAPSSNFCMSMMQHAALYIKHLYFHEG